MVLAARRAWRAVSASLTASPWRAAQRLHAVLPWPAVPRPSGASPSPAVRALLGAWPSREVLAPLGALPWPGVRALLGAWPSREVLEPPGASVSSAACSRSLASVSATASPPSRASAAVAALPALPASTAWTASGASDASACAARWANATSALRGDRTRRAEPAVLGASTVRRGCRGAHDQVGDPGAHRSVGAQHRRDLRGCRRPRIGARRRDPRRRTEPRVPPGQCSTTRTLPRARSRPSRTPCCVDAGAWLFVDTSIANKP